MNRVQIRVGQPRPEGVVDVSRGTRWQNPYTLRTALSTMSGRTSIATARVEALQAFRRSITPEFRELIVSQLRGKTLACRCPTNQPCHADILLEIANEH